ncbi:hypothetical protein AX17_000272 [Amanita inopinata Kibby_2008]|nr:hypothetical protein AX17_000272 [Amanita inopinata Kibby_2008]
MYAFVSLLTSDPYLPGALALAAALNDLHPSPQIPFQTVCLVTPETVDVTSIKLLRKAFDTVVGVEVIEQEDTKGLTLLGRPDLRSVLTKLHIFRLTQFSKIIFLDADVLPVRPLSHLFTLPYEFSAVPDVGWPDIFNSGVLVFSPGEDKFRELIQLLKSKGSWDGGDQGILNEWRGDNWNRLSFIYNTTPTAAYTYAPAYERFGSQISAIHFIGPNKPWKSLPYRSPFTRTSPTESSEQAYDYNSLLDCWFNIYDRHYRSQPILTGTNFEVKKYVAAWEEQQSHVKNTSDTASPSGTAFSLEELKKVALEGLHTVTAISEKRAGEGDYVRLPLEGRVDLMRPKRLTEFALAEEVQECTPFTPTEQSLGDREARVTWQAPPTPDPKDMPPSPRPKPISLPPTPTPQTLLSGTSVSGPALVQERELSRDDIGSEDKKELQEIEPPSPPLLIWNPAIEPPPTTAPESAAFPADTYFPNVWDQTPSGGTSGIDNQDYVQLFQPPPTPDIPKPLIQQGHYRSVTGESTQGMAPSPDPTKIKHIFPWEDKPRAMPGRVFPPADTPSPSQYLSTSEYPKSPTRANSSGLHMPLSPLRGLPVNLAYSNAWDTIPSIQRYASRLVRPSPAPTLGPAFDEGKNKSWEDKTEASSRDGDDEDEDEGEESSADESDREASKRMSRRTSVVSASELITGRKRHYKARGIQTMPRETRSQSVQVPNFLVPKNSAASLFPSSDIQSPLLLTGDVSLQPDLPMTTAVPSPAGEPERTLQNPLVSTREQGPTPQLASQGASHSVQSSIRLSAIKSPSAISRQISNDSSLGSPLSSGPPVSPTDVPTGHSPLRKGGRVWDPARGVELFKRGSEEVLARFLKMGSWEDEASRSPH